MSRNYARMAIGNLEHCEYYSEVSGPIGGGPVEPSGEARPVATECEQCHYWLPFVTMPLVGQCDNPSSRYYGRPAFSDKPTEECYVERSLEGLDFLWCQTHRQTIYAAEVPDHRGCHLFVKTASIPVEDEMELTVAGD